MSKSTKNAPEYPFIIFNEYYVCKPEYRSDLNIMTEKGYLNGRFKEKAHVIDQHCRKFAVLDVLNHGRSWSPLNWSPKHKMIKVEYIYGTPNQLSFDEAREEYVELICRRGWWSESYENEGQFRKRNASYETMRQLMEPVSFAGKWMF